MAQKGGSHSPRNMARNIIALLCISVSATWTYRVSLLLNLNLHLLSALYRTPSKWQEIDHNTDVNLVEVVDDAFKPKVPETQGKIAERSDIPTLKLLVNFV